MQLKLEYSKQVLEGLAMEDYEKIAKNSQSLGLLSLESGWKIIQTEDGKRRLVELGGLLELARPEGDVPQVRERPRLVQGVGQGAEDLEGLLEVASSERVITQPPS